MQKKLILSAVIFFAFLFKANASVCFANETEFAPYSSANYGWKNNNNGTQITPTKVYNHVLRLQYKLAEIGVVAKTHSQTLLIRTAMPRSNLLLAFDLFQLTQNWHQQQVGIVSRTPNLKIPFEIKPVHIYQWVDATFAYLNCSYPNNNPSIPKFESEVKTPRDVFYLIEEVISQLLSAMGDGHIEQLIAHRIYKSHHLAQDIVLAERGERVADWKLLAAKSLKSESLEPLLVKALYQAQQLTGANYISKTMTIGTLSKSDKLRLNYLSTTLMLTELIHLSTNRNQNELLVAYAGAVLLLDPDKLWLRVKDILQLLRRGA